MSKPQRSEVWLIDLGMVAKVRPCLVLSIPLGDDDRVLMTLVPHTTSVRGSRFEVTVTVPFLRTGAVRCPKSHHDPRSERHAPIEDAVRFWLGL